MGNDTWREFQARSTCSPSNDSELFVLVVTARDMVALSSVKTVGLEVGPGRN